LERPDANVGSQAFLTTLHPSIASQASTIVQKSQEIINRLQTAL